MNLTKQKETHRSRELTYGCLGAGAARGVAQTAVSYNQGGLFILGLQEP